MRILMLSWEYPPHIVGGMGKHVMDLAPALAQAGVEVHVITPLLRGGVPHEITPEGVHILRIEPPRMEDYGFTTFADETNNAIARVLRTRYAGSQPFDLIHAHDWLVASTSISLKHTWRVPLLATIHATERGRGQGRIGNGQAEHINNTEWRLTYEAWRVITCSHFMAGQVRDYFHTPADKIDVIPNGVHIRPDPFISAEERGTFRRRFAADDQPLVFYVGRMVYEKGSHILLDAWPQVLAAYPRAQLLIAGTGPYLDSIKARAWELGLGPSAIFTGYIPDDERDRLYHIADVAVFPSLYEPFGIVALEAMAACCPVVVTDTGGLAEVVRLHETGLTVYPNNPNSLAWGILHTLDHPDWAHMRAENALREARDIYNWRNVAAATLATYERVYAAWRECSWGKELALAQSFDMVPVEDS